MKKKNNKAITILWIICLVPLFIGLILMGESKVSVTYSTDEYWVAKDYHHIYEKTSGNIENLIEENENCEIKGDEIIVTTTNKTMFGWGCALTILFGMGTIGAIWGTLETSGVIDRIKNAIINK